MNKKLVVLAEYRDLFQAGLALSTLETQGIQCFSDNQYYVGFKWSNSTPVGGVKLKVRARDALLANEIICSFEPDCADDSERGKLKSKATCPFCGSLEINSRKDSQKLTAMRHWFSLFLGFFLKRNRCTECGHRRK